MAKDFARGISLIFLKAHGCQMADPRIEALKDSICYIDHSTEFVSHGRAVAPITPPYIRLTSRLKTLAPAG